MLKHLIAGWHRLIGIRPPETAPEPAEAEQPQAKARKPRGPYQRGTCPHCGQSGVALTRDGEPNRRHHKDCRPTVHVPSVWTAPLPDLPVSVTTTTSGPGADIRWSGEVGEVRR